MMIHGAISIIGAALALRICDLNICFDLLFQFFLFFSFYLYSFGKE
jgi:hypothetical protein